MAGYPRLLHTVLDTTRPRELAEFYRRLLGLRYRAGDGPPADEADDDPDWLVLTDPTRSASSWGDRRGRPFTPPPPGQVRIVSAM